MTKALFIGRFQPFHLGHLKDIKDISKDVNKVVIAVGSSQEEGTKNNPYSFKLRKKMIEKSLDKEGIGNYDIMAVPDINDDSVWVEHVIKITGRADVVLTGNGKTKRLFEEKGFKVKKVDILEGITGTKIRSMIEKNKGWRKLVHEEVHKVISDLKG